MEVDPRLLVASEEAASHGFGVEIPPFHAEVLAGNFSFWLFYQNEKFPPKPLHGMGVLVGFSFLTKWSKTRCVSDLALTVIVRYAASFGEFDQK